MNFVVGKDAHPTMLLFIRLGFAKVLVYFVSEMNFVEFSNKSAGKVFKKSFRQTETFAKLNQKQKINQP